MGSPVSHLPAPTRRRVDPPALEPEQRHRQEEVDRYLAELYDEQGWRIVETTQTYIGDIVDWLDPASIPGSQIEQPPKPPPEELQPGPGRALQRTELDEHPELRGPEGTIPVTRPSFARYVLGEVEADSLEDYLAESDAPGQPMGQNRLYAGLGSRNANTMATGWINPFGGGIESGTFSLLEMAVLCPGLNPDVTLEQVGVAASRDLKNFSDSVVRLRVEFLTAGEQTGNYIGGWDGKRLGFVPAAGRPYGPGLALTPLSTIGGLQYDSSYQIQLFNGNWWVGHNGNWLGYYEGWRFELMGLIACEAHWYGEVYDPTPTDWTWGDMGSGLFASAGHGSASYFRKPYYLDPAGLSHWPEGANTGNVGPRDLTCYTNSSLLISAAPFDRVFYLGGPGGDAPGCN